MSISVAGIKNAYDAFLTAKAAVVTAQTAVTALGARPVMPTEVDADADYNSVITAQATYDTSLASAKATLATAQAAVRTAEMAVITVMGYGGTNPQGDNGQDEWFKVVGAGAGYLTYTHWIGYSSNATYLTISTVQPTKPFPGV